MSNKTILLSFYVAAAFTLGCNEPTKETTAAVSDTFASVKTDTLTTPTISTADNSRTSVDWPGTYKGIVPCADCEGIETTITIGLDSSYTLTKVYLGKKDSKPIEKKGKFIWDAYGGSILLDGITNAPDKYKVGENVLIQLDLNGNTITGDNAAKYRLTKQTAAATAAPAAYADITLQDTYWKVTELMGKPVSAGEKGKEMFLKLLTKDNRAQGNGGCNGFFGKYELDKMSRIKFSAMASTQMACPNLEQESAFLKVLGTADSYMIKGNKLQLIKARMAPLAVFEAVNGK
jgi:heat shock protein HslJ